MSIRDSILNAQDSEYEPVEAWGLKLTLRTLSGKERDKFEASQVRMNKKGQPERNLDNIRARLVVLTLVDPEDGYLPVFTEKDIPLLGEKSARELDKVYSAALKLNGFTNQDIEDLAENFNSAPSESSTSE